MGENALADAGAQLGAFFGQVGVDVVDELGCAAQFDRDHGVAGDVEGENCRVVRGPEHGFDEACPGGDGVACAG